MFSELHTNRFVSLQKLLLFKRKQNKQQQQSIEE